MRKSAFLSAGDDSGRPADYDDGSPARVFWTGEVDQDCGEDSSVVLSDPPTTPSESKRALCSLPRPLRAIESIDGSIEAALSTLSGSEEPFPDYRDSV